MIHYLFNLIKKHKQYIQTCMVGLFSLILQLIIFNILRLHMKATFANTIAVECAIISNFILNHHITFKDKKSIMTSWLVWIKKFLMFNLVSLSSMIVQFICLHISTITFGNHAMVDNIAVIIGIILGSIVNFIWYKFIIWR